MKRTAKPGEFRSNVHLGGKAENYETTPQEEESAVRAAKVLGLHVAGVDLIQSERGPLVLEVNSSPGLEGIETASQIDVAGKRYSAKAFLKPASISSSFSLKAAPKILSHLFQIQSAL